MIIVSNYAPSHFPEILNDEGMMERIIEVKFEESDRIPSELRMADLIPFLKEMTPQLLNWAIFLPAEIFKYHIRNSFYKSQFLNERALDSAEGFEAFLMDCFVYDESPSSFTPIEDLEMAMKEYAERTGDPSLERYLTRKLPKKYLSENIPRITFDYFEKKIIPGRYSGKAPLQVGDPSILRPYGFRYLSRKNKDGSLNPGQSFFERRQFSDLQPMIPMHLASTKIQWVESSRQEFVNIQSQIRDRRAAIKQKEAEQRLLLLGLEEQEGETSSLEEEGETPLVENDLSKGEFFNWEKDFEVKPRIEGENSEEEEDKI